MTMKRLARRLVFAQATDVITFCAFFILVPVSVHAERNPLIAAVFALGGFALVGLVKMGFVSVVAYRAAHFEPSRKLVISVSVATASGIAGAGFNIASIIDSMT